MTFNLYSLEYDSLWGDDAKSAILNPETLLFQNVAAYQACKMIA
ncbi:conjugative transfer domain protein [Orientia chuto str. Dubai]|uniref:Conjugative transfer domain protein n=1 Tax=Orientia chuto str. Dubai TaxID=1359168 RepID=A0A0F3MND3_9RICK|nr:hypothetical protein [Candidatus Orientia mediorientalis]KJV57161.1 conjugative transfer domain protein [Orientia chuto str. Dubai]